MAKIDKSQYSKEHAAKLMELRRLEKARQQVKDTKKDLEKVLQSRNFESETGFVLGNGTSRQSINPKILAEHGKIYGCNALYREFEPDYLIAVDVKMILEISKSGYQNTHEVWTNKNKAYQKIENLNFFYPSKGWSSGPTALYLATQHQYKRIFILGFDYKGLNEGKTLNNIYADTINYKKSSDSATYYGNWLKQTTTIIKQNPRINFYRVIQPDNYVPPELNKFNNLKHIYVDDFKKMFNIS